MCKKNIPDFQRCENPGYSKVSLQYGYLSLLNSIFLVVISFPLSMVRK